MSILDHLDQIVRIRQVFVCWTVRKVDERPVVGTWTRHRRVFIHHLNVHVVLLVVADVVHLLVQQWPLQRVHLIQIVGLIQRNLLVRWHVRIELLVVGKRLLSVWELLIVGKLLLVMGKLLVLGKLFVIERHGLRKPLLVHIRMLLIVEIIRWLIKMHLMEQILMLIDVRNRRTRQRGSIGNVSRR